MQHLTPLLAYIDPGSGSFILQVIVGTLLGASVAAKMYWHRLRGFVAGRFARKPRHDEPAE
jgi:hypothetical protein